MKNNTFFIFATILIFNSCNLVPGNQVEVFEAVLGLKTITSKRIEVLHKSVNSNQSIVRPPGVWIPLAKIIKDSKDAFCLIYKTPKKDLGELRLVSISVIETCRKKYEREPIATIKVVEKLNLFFSTTDISNNSAFVLKLIFFHNNKEHNFKFPIYNYTLSHQKNFERYSDAIKVSKSSGMKLYFSETNDLNEVVICHKVDQNCNNIKKNICHKCQNGFTEVVSFYCPQGGMKLCGQIDCGVKGNPACIRGSNYNNSSRGIICSSESTAGFCIDGSNIFCNEENILVCL